MFWCVVDNYCQGSTLTLLIQIITGSESQAQFLQIPLWNDLNLYPVSFHSCPQLKVDGVTSFKPSERLLFSSSNLGSPKHSENQQLFLTLASNLFMKHFIEIYNFRANGNGQRHNWILANHGMYWCEQKDQDETESWLLLWSWCQSLSIGQCALQDCRKHWLIGDWYGFWCSSLSEKGVFKYLQWALEASKIRME